MTDLEKKVEHLSCKIDSVQLSLDGWCNDKTCPTADKIAYSLEKEKFKLSIQYAKLVTKYTFLC